MKILLWGAGAECKINIDIMPPEWEILGIVDSDSGKVGKKINQIEIIGKEKLGIYEYDYIAITSSKYYSEIFDTIKKCGISPLKIIDGARCRKNLTQEEHINYYRNLIQEKNMQKASEYRFENRSKGSDKLFYVLAGYKIVLWSDVSERMKRFIPDYIDVCILSSGKYVEELAETAEQNGWSYLSTSINDVGIIQNIVVDLFPEAKYIYKMDEDVYITKYCCEKMLEAYKEAKKGEFNVGFVGPMIPLHTNGYLFLKRFGLEEAYENCIGVRHTPGGRWTNRGYASDTKIPIFLWSRGNIDDLNRKVYKDEKFVISPIKYAICFILFERSTFENMGGFRIIPETRTAGINGDEGQLMEYCMHHCLCTVVATNTICGHFSYPEQEKEMLLFRDSNRQYFELK